MTENLVTNPAQEDVMLPAPSADQIAMFDRIDASLDDEQIVAKRKFNRLPPEAIKHLASLETAKQIEIIQKENQLRDETASLIAHVAALAAIGALPENEIAAAVQQNGNVTVGTAQGVANALVQKVLAPIKDMIVTAHFSSLQADRETGQEAATQTNPVAISKPQLPAALNLRQPANYPASRPATPPPAQFQAAPRPEPRLNGNIVNLKP